LKKTLHQEHGVTVNVLFLNSIPHRRKHGRPNWELMLSCMARYV